MNMIKPEPAYGRMHRWENYAADLMVEYQQCLEEGKDVEACRALMEAVWRMPAGAHQARMADALYDLLLSLPMRADYAYDEPDALDAIRQGRTAWTQDRTLDRAALKDRVRGAWLGRVCGCLLGKPIEGIHTHELYPLLQESGNWPLHRYILSSDISERRKRLNPFFAQPNRQWWADGIDRAPADDDTNYTVMAQLLVEQHGRDFSPEDVAQLWLDCQPKKAYCTAERVAYCNFVRGFLPPQSALYHNPYREWIGAQIRGDYFGYINPGDPEAAAEMAWRDASISHVKNGIYGEMFAAAMIAQAAVEDDLPKIIKAGLAQIPAASRLHEAVQKVLDGFREGMAQADCQAMIHAAYDENTSHGWCHTIPNAMIVAMALLYGEGDFAKSICMAVQACFDTDCNGATVGSVLGMRNGAAAVGEEWTAPLRGRLDTAIFGVGTVEIEALVSQTMRHLKAE